MNYIEQINGFWNKSENSDLTGLDIAVYMSLLKYCNRLNWLNPFVCHWDIVCQTSKVSKNAYYKSLERLTELGFIKSEKGVKNTSKKPKIFILELKNSKGIVREQQGNKEGTEEEQQGNLYKQYKQLNNKQINIILEHYNSLPSDLLDERIKELKPLENIDKIDFDIFWNLYGKKKGDKDKVKSKWDNLSKSTQQKIIETIPSFKKSVSDIQFLPFPQTYLNDKRWNDDLNTSQDLFSGETEEEKDLRIRREYFNNIKIH